MSEPWRAPAENSISASPSTEHAGPNGTHGSAHPKARDLAFFSWGGGEGFLLLCRSGLRGAQLRSWGSGQGRKGRLPPFWRTRTPTQPSSGAVVSPSAARSPPRVHRLRPPHAPPPWTPAPRGGRGGDRASGGRAGPRCVGRGRAAAVAWLPERSRGRGEPSGVRTEGSHRLRAPRPRPGRPHPQPRPRGPGRSPRREVGAGPAR